MELKLLNYLDLLIFLCFLNQQLYATSIHIHLDRPHCTHVHKSSRCIQQAALPHQRQLEKHRIASIMAALPFDSSRIFLLEHMGMVNASLGLLSWEV